MSEAALKDKKEQLYMPCLHPVNAWRSTFSDYKRKKTPKPFFREPVQELLNKGVVEPLRLPCGKCTDCLFKRSREAAVRSMHEASMHQHNSFLTLTYAPEHLPKDGSLVKEDYQLFLKRLRERLQTKFSYYLCGEYGNQRLRPHYHVCLFGVRFNDMVPLFRSDSNHTVYKSALLDETWGKGICSIGSVTFESAAYVARYVSKKMYGADKELYGNLLPEFSQSSLKTPLGKAWFEQFKTDVFPHDHVIFKGKTLRPPRYYFKLLERENPDLAFQIKMKRREKAIEQHENFSDDRLLSLEKIQQERFMRLKRSMEDGIQDLYGV